MAEYIGNEYKDESVENQNALSPSQVAKWPNIRQTSHTPKSSSVNHIHVETTVPVRPQYIYSAQYHTPLIEHASDLSSNSIIYDGERPGTPALIREQRTLEDSDYIDPEVAEFASVSFPHRYGPAEARAFSGEVVRDPNIAYPPTVAPPTSPSQLYSLLLQRNLRPADCPVIEQRSQAFVPNYIEWNAPNSFYPRSFHQNEHRRAVFDFRERDRIVYRPFINVRQRFEQYSHVDRRPFLNQNYSRLPYNMVRIKNSNDDSENNTMNGFAEDDEGNHEHHDLHHDSVPILENPMASGIEHHHNGLHQIGTAELPETNGVNLANIYQGEWPMHRALWMSGPSSIGEKDPLDGFGGDDTESIMSFSSTTASMSSRRPHQLGTKVEMVYSLLSMLGSCNKEDMSRTLLEMSNNQDSCIAMRQSGCLPLLIQLLHGSERDQVLPEQRSSSNVKWAVREARRRASQALHNIVHAHPDDRRGRREARVLRLLEQIRDYSDFLRDLGDSNVGFSHNENLDLHPGPAIAALMKLSFDEEHRHAMCQLGGLQAIAELIQADHEVHGNTSDQFCVTVRRYAGMALTNLTFGDGTNKALLCSMKPFMQALVAQLHSPSEDLRQVTASVLRNLSWRADNSSKQILREVGVVTTLMMAAMEANKESTLKSILSALWNLSAHCSMNKADICETEGALEFLVSTLTYKSASSTLSIVENGGGILRNVSSHIAVREDYRAILRKHKCLQTLLSHLKSPSLTIVSNACGTLWNLSARCAEDQKALWEMGAVGMLRNLVHSKHKMISMGSSAALKNLLSTRPEGLGSHSENGHHMNGSITSMPTLLVRKQRALAADIDESLSETCDNIDSPKTSPTPQTDFRKKFLYETNGYDKRPQFLSYLPGRMYHSINGHVGSPVRVPRSESKDSLGSTRSEPPHYKAQRERFKILVNNNKISTLDSRIVQEKPSEWKEKTNLPYEGNSNIVLQLFRQLQNETNVDSGTASGTDGEESSKPEIKSAVRPNSLPPPKHGVWNVRNGHHNGVHLPPTESEFAFSKLSNHLTNAQSLRSDADPNHLLNIPGNKRGYTNGVAGNAPDYNGYSSALPKEVNSVGKTNVVLRRKKNSDIMSSSAVFTNRDSMGDENSSEQTPLVISRCSSLSSLTSCFQHSARSSWVSDASQRTSSIISPSDLPDSPSCCVSENKPHIYEFTDKIPDPEAHGLIRPRPAWPSSSVLSSDSLPSSIKRMSLDSDVFVNSSETVPIEPLMHPIESSNDVTPVSYKSPPERPQNSPTSPEKDSCPSTETSSSPDNEGDRAKETTAHVDLPNNSNDITRNNSILHSKLNNLCSSFSYSKSGIPIKTNFHSSLTQSFPSSSNPDSGSNTNSSGNLANLNSASAYSKPVDDNDNLISGNINGLEKLNNFQSSGNSSSFMKQKFETSQHNLTDSGKSLLSSFESKCLNICKKYPALSQKSSFRESVSVIPKLSSTDFIGSKARTSIPQIIRSDASNVQPAGQLEMKSLNFPVYSRSAETATSTQRDTAQKPHLENTSSTEENASEDILSSSPSACDECESDEAALNSKPAVQLRNNRIKTRKFKSNRRSMEVRPPSEHSSEDDNKKAFASSAASSAVCHVTLSSSGSEEKVKVDEKSKEKLSMGIIPDILEGTSYHSEFPGTSMEDRRNATSAKSNIPRSLTDSMELRRGALMIAAELEEGLDDCTHSSTSFDLENMKPPSCMAEMSMTSSGLSDLLSNGNGCYINGKCAVDRRRNIKKSKKLTNSRRFVLKSVRQVLASNLELSKQKESLDKPISASTSIENISMKSSGTSDLLDNINPPSMLDDISMTNSCASLNSISSDILESRSQSLADPRSNSEMFQRLNAAAAMVQVYSRELSNIMTGSMRSSCNSDCLDLVKPPSVFQDIAEVTVEDGTEVASDQLVSDFEIEEELPHDDEASVPSETVQSPFLHSKKDLDESTENLNSSMDGDSQIERDPFLTKKISSLALEPQQHRMIDIANNTVQHSFSGRADNDAAEGVDPEQDDARDSDSGENKIAPTSAVRRGPRIVKPINRETVRQMQEKKNAEKSIKSVRGRAPVNKPRNLLQQVTSARMNTANKTSAAKSSVVRPTRTSALRASQNKQTSNIRSSGGRMSPRSFLSKPPPVSKRPPRVVKPQSEANTDKKSESAEVKRPDPPVKQGTFTKEESCKVPPVASPASDNLSSENSGDDQNNNDKSPSAAAISPSTCEPKLLDRKLSFSMPPVSALPQTNRLVQRKLSAPAQRKNLEKSGLPLSPSSNLSHEDRFGKKFGDKKSPSSNNITNKTVSTAGSRTASTNSLSSLSSTSQSVKKSNSQKDVPSKISSIWKRSESSSSANSPGTDNSNIDKSIPVSSRNKAISSRSTLRSNSVTPPNASKGIPRSSTYEKITNSNDSVKIPKVSPTSTVNTNKVKHSAATASKPVVKKPQPGAPKVTGGARIVKPVTPRPKPNAITSRSLRQSNYNPYSEGRNYSISSASSACISIERTSRFNQDSKVSIPLVTAPFANEKEQKDLDRTLTECHQFVNGGSSSPIGNKQSNDSESDNDRD